MARIKWDASGQSGVMSPNDNKLNNDVSEPTDKDFGGHREYSKTASSEDYTSRSNTMDKKENPVDDTVKDIDDLTDPKQRKRELSRREETSNVQKSNESAFSTQSTSDNRPPENTDDFVSDNDPVKRYRSKDKYNFGDGQYEGEIR
jgi:hypothetical protein